MTQLSKTTASMPGNVLILGLKHKQNNTKTQFRWGEDDFPPKLYLFYLPTCDDKNPRGLPDARDMILELHLRFN